MNHRHYIPYTSVGAPISILLYIPHPTEIKCASSVLIDEILSRVITAPPLKCSSGQRLRSERNSAPTDITMRIPGICVTSGYLLIIYCYADVIDDWQLLFFLNARSECRQRVIITIIISTCRMALTIMLLRLLRSLVFPYDVVIVLL